MSDKPTVILTADSEVVLKKKQAWSEVGAIVHNANIDLEQKAKEVLVLLIPPTTIDEVAAAEATLKEVKLRLGIIEADRKMVTSKFDTVTSALMAHEKSVKEALPAYSASIIAIKKAHEAEQAKVQAAINKDKAEKEAAINYMNKAYVDMKTEVARICQAAYEHALGKGNITEAKLPKYLDAVRAKKTAKDFVIAPIPGGSPELFDYAYNAIDMAPPELMLNYFYKQLEIKFEFFNVALKNKEAAVLAAKQKEDADAAERAEELANSQMAARLETIATTTDAVVNDGIKELKKKYELDLPDTEQNAILIMTAFITNYASVKDGVRVKSMRSLSVEQMGTALAWLKNKDDKFTFTGINFKITEKL